MNDLSYITLFLPYSGKLGKDGSRLLYGEVVDYLEENVGLGTMDFRQWLLGGEHRQHEWCYSGLDHSPESNFTAVCRVFHFRDSSKALMFKLTWGGM